MTPSGTPTRSGPEPTAPSRRDFLRFLGSGAAVIGLGLEAGGQQWGRPPNVVVILTDDQGYGDLGCYGATAFPTPHLDRMAGEGVRFTDFYVSEAVCSASRASLLTGCYAQRVGIRGALMPFSTTGLDPGETTIARMLKTRGYATGIFGKWHLGHLPEFLPLQHGFDEYCGLPYSNDMWPVDFDGRPTGGGNKGSYPPLPLMEGNEQAGIIATLADQNTLTGLYTRRAVQFIERHKDRPFFLYVPHSMPHVPLGVSDRFRGTTAQGMYGDVIAEIDWSVGEILAALRRNGLDRDTLVVFLSDNGPWLNFGNHAGTTGILREGKGAMWEGGVRVPCIMRWPEQIRPGRVCTDIAASIDILPTVAEACAARLPARAIDGVSLLPLLDDRTHDGPRREYLFYYEGELHAVREDRWKLHLPHTYRSYVGVTPGVDGHPGRYASGRTGTELYDLTADPGETRDVAASHPEIVERLLAIARNAREELGDAITGHTGRGVRKPGLAGAARAGHVTTLAAGGMVTLRNAPSTRYGGEGGRTLVDGIRGSLHHGDGAWLGFEGTDFEAVIGLPAGPRPRRVAVSFLENHGAWIFLPPEVEVGVSADGTVFERIGAARWDTTTLLRMPGVRELTAAIPGTVPVRFVRVVARNVGACPPWHAGAGGKAWLFVDEIVVT